MKSGVYTEAGMSKAALSTGSNVNGSLKWEVFRGTRHTRGRQRPASGYETGNVVANIVDPSPSFFVVASSVDAKTA